MSRVEVGDNDCFYIQECLHRAWQVTQGITGLWTYPAVTGGQDPFGGEHGIYKKADCAIFQQDRSITNLGQFQTASPLMKIWPPENAFSGGQIDLWEQRELVCSFR